MSRGRRAARMAQAGRSLAELSAGAVVLMIAAGFVAYAASNTGQITTNGTHLLARFDNVGSLSAGSDVRVGGVKVGRVTGATIDPHSYQALVAFTVQSSLNLPSDSSATVATGGLLGGAFLNLSPGGSDTMLHDGQTMSITQSATNLEDLLGKFIFNVGSLADATEKSLQQKASKRDP